MLFDPILDRMMNDHLDLYGSDKGDSGFVCSHCYKRIYGKVHRIETNYFDAFCYSMRFSLGYEKIKRNVIEGS
ncbi:MAG: hypothetical protein QGH39_12115 [Candidatus Thermoplasmatota archaeon]|nr:hypothetical protein [Candidatus Thermoplasmatota archaeon]